MGTDVKRDPRSMFMCPRREAEYRLRVHHGNREAAIQSLERDAGMRPGHYMYRAAHMIRCGEVDVPESMGGSEAG